MLWKCLCFQVILQCEFFWKFSESIKIVFAIILWHFIIQPCRKIYNDLIKNCLSDLWLFSRSAPCREAGRDDVRAAAVAPTPHARLYWPAVPLTFPHFSEILLGWIQKSNILQIIFKDIWIVSCPMRSDIYYLLWNLFYTVFCWRTVIFFWTGYYEN